MKHLLICALALILCSCATTNPSPGIVPNTLGNNRKIHSDIIQGLFTQEGWSSLLARPYAGYVVLRAKIVDGGHVANPRIMESFPDNSRDELAKKFSVEWKITAPTVDSRMPHLAEIYVVFYEPTKATRQVIVFGDSLGDSIAPVKMSAPNLESKDLEKTFLYTANY